MLFLHEVHKVVGTKTDEFEQAFRTGLMPALAKGDDARLLWYTNHAMGSGVSYNVVTITAVKDGAAWERLALRFQKGDLQGWVRDADTLRHDAAGKLLLPLHWSPLQGVDFGSIPSDGREHALSLYMEDTMALPRAVPALYRHFGCGLLQEPASGRPLYQARGGVPARVRQSPAPRSHADAEDREGKPAPRAAQSRNTARAAAAGRMDARGFGAARSMGE
jgi:hypothetical protein